MSDDIFPIGQDDLFQFECNCKVPCFNECCRDLNQFLTPYDILRLKKGLGISSTRFLEQYTGQHIGPETGLPVISLRPLAASAKTCPFVTPSGCRVYADRPGSCRMYPLARMISRSRETGAITEHYAVIQESHCLGFQQQGRQTVTGWIRSQDLLIYNEMNDLMMDIIHLKNRSSTPGASLSLKDAHLFQMAAYDIDRFRTHVNEHGLLEETCWNRYSPEQLKTDDTALLRFGLAWIRRILFGE